MKNVVNVDCLTSATYPNDSFRVEVLHKPCDPDSVRRIMLTNPTLSVEILPSKGMSIGEAFYLDKPFFWIPPQPSLLAKDSFDINAPFVVRGQENTGLRWVEAFTGGVELLGLSNWGLRREEKGVVYGLHGEASNISVNSFDILFESEFAQVKASFLVFDWDEQGYPAKNQKPIYRVTRRIRIQKHGKALELFDDIENISTHQRVPQWGYHIQLRPQAGAELISNSANVENRKDEPLSDTYNVWQPVPYGENRIEKGAIHQGLACVEINGVECVRPFLKYQDNSGIVMHLPRSPFYLSWVSAGGAGTDEFCYPVNKLGEYEPLLKRSWDGI
ncbi:DUF4432 family protein [Alginatibacterium sediminis]|uniref:DUF4432 family protein n=1 Tax=Alginatibacterium sediminis TaxID=2164068 RepID=A0A420E7I3_9ALTE|nr:DUF4432 family protein [Alginatibacterium sediminis]RKF14369.1 DUF4432 family protein [Alginatibacterium sediminis]